LQFVSVENLIGAPILVGIFGVILEDWALEHCPLVGNGT